MNVRTLLLKIFPAALAVVLLSGCSLLKPTPAAVEMPAETRRLLSRLTLQNVALEQFKGLGTVRTTARDGAQQAMRVAWIAEAPDKLRLSVLNIGGLPTATMAADGEHFFLASHAPKKYYKIRATNPSLKKLIGIDLKAREIIAVLGGRVPIREFDNARLETDAATGRRVLVLSSRRGRVIEKIYLAEDPESARSVEMFDAAGRRMYTLKMSKIQPLEGGFRVPFHIDVTSGGDRLQLQVQRYWAHAAAAPSTFTLTESEM
jgi:outer membrane biogenesis lipoprotein LolB